MSRGIKNTILLTCIALYIIVYKLFLFTNFMKYSDMITSSFLVALLAGSIFFLGYRKNKTDIDGKYIMRIVVFFISMTFLAMYALGFLTGFLKNGYSLNFLTLINNILAPIIIIILVEIFRYVVIWANRDKKIFVVLFTLALTALEWAISVRTFQFHDVIVFFRVATTVLIPSFIKNALLSYLCYHVGYKANLAYRLVMDIYYFVVPIVPNLGDYLQSMFLIALPILIYINASSYLDEREKKAEYTFEEESFSIWDIPITAFLIILAALVSGVFPHYMIGVGSQSMSPTINKGDAIILRKVNEKTNLAEGDIIAFQSNERTVIHRIQDVMKQNGQTFYITKGDANKGVDTNMVSRKQIRGVVKMKIPYVAYPTIWFTSYLKK